MTKMLVVATVIAFTIKSVVLMTQQASTSVSVDWQIQLPPGTNSKIIIVAVGQSTSYTALQQVDYAESTGFTSQTNGTVQTTGPGKVLGISPQYRQDFPTQLRPLIGAPNGVLIAQQTAANLHITVGDRVTIHRVGLPPVTTKIDGVVDLPKADFLFQAIGVPAGVTPQASPDNVLLLPSNQWHQFFDQQAVIRPSSVRTQLHVHIGDNLPDGPWSAYAYVQQLAKNLEAKTHASDIVGNNLAAYLDGAPADAHHARVLFLVLGLLGVILAVLLALAATTVGKDRRR